MAIIRGTGRADVLYDTPEADTIYGLSGDDIIHAGDGDLIDGGKGFDQLFLGAKTGNTVQVARVESITGGGGIDSVFATAAVSGAHIDLGSGADLFSFGDFTGSAILDSVATILGGNGRQTATLAGRITGGVIDLGAGDDTLDFGDFDGTASVQEVETILGGAGKQRVAAGGDFDGSIDLGADRGDRVDFGDFDATAVIRNVETVLGGPLGIQHVTFGERVTGTLVDLGGDAGAFPDTSDTVFLGDFASSIKLRDTAFVFGGSGGQTVTMLAPYGNAGFSHGPFIDLGAGHDTVNLGGFDGSSALIENVEKIVAGAGSQFANVTGVHHGFVDLGAGSDRLNIEDLSGVTDLRVRNVESITSFDFEEHGGRGVFPVDAKVTLAGPTLPDPVHVNLGGGGIDTLDLRQYHGAVDVADGGIENIIGGGDDNLLDLGSLLGALPPDAAGYGDFYSAAPRVDGGGGFDTVAFTTPTTDPLALTVSNVERVTGGPTADHLIVKSAPQGIDIDLGGGADLITFNPRSAAAGASIAGFRHGSDKLDLSPYHLVLLPENSSLDGSAAQATTHYDAAHNVTEVLINLGLGHSGADEVIEVSGAHLTTGDFVL
ncbi:MAG: M10 family metallopeptidase C-terminal domain-containing protein [Rhodospirillaceae bacterium]|nr:M10 family metallopeptidase C-terminal domain-containing protein [Rhodospirillaceae bacterium]